MKNWKIKNWKLNGKLVWVNCMVCHAIDSYDTLTWLENLVVFNFRFARRIDRFRSHFNEKCFINITDFDGQPAVGKNQWTAISFWSSNVTHESYTIWFLSVIDSSVLHMTASKRKKELLFPHSHCEHSHVREYKTTLDWN